MVANDGMGQVAPVKDQEEQVKNELLQSPQRDSDSTKNVVSDSCDIKASIIITYESQHYLKLSNQRLYSEGTYCKSPKASQFIEGSHILYTVKRYHVYACTTCICDEVLVKSSANLPPHLACI